MQVYAYLKAFSAAFGLDSLLRLNTRVVRALPVTEAQNGAEGKNASRISGDGDGGGGGSRQERWRVTIAPAAGGSGQSERTFDALVVCNGHFSEPRLPDAPGERLA